MKILLIESGILSFGIQNPSSADKDWNPAPGIRNPWHGMRNPRLSWIPYMGRAFDQLNASMQ